MPDADRPRNVRFGLYEADLQAGELSKNGLKVKLQNQPFQVLALLLQHAGDVVTREELRQKLWPTDTFVDFEHGLNAAVKRLRDALAESAENPVFIETLARRGYRFNGSIEIDKTTQQGRFSSLALRAVRIRERLGMGRTGTVAVVAMLLAVVSWAVYRSGSRNVTSRPSVHSLAVLPLENLSRDPEQEYFSDGMTEELIAQLSKIGGLRITSRTSAMRYKNTHKSLAQIASELKVDGVIEGSVMRSDNRVRIVVQLVEARKDQHLWAESYERDLGDVLKLQSEVAQAVAQQVRIQLTPAQQARLRAATEVDPQAYEAFLKGRFYERNGTKASIRQAQAYFDEAVRRDPAFALAYVGLADCYLDLGSYRWLAPQDAYRLGNQAVHRALQLNEHLGEAHSTLGYLTWQYAWDWQTAEKELRYGVELNPSYIEGHESLLWYLAWSGRYDEAASELEQIRHLDPVFPLIHIEEAGISYHKRDYKALMKAGQESVAIYPDGWASHYFLAVGYQGSGRMEEAVREYQKAVDLSQQDSDAIAGLAHAYAALGRSADSLRLLAELQKQAKVGYVSPYMIAAIYSGLGQKDKAFEYLERAYDQRSPDIAYFLRSDLRMDPLRADPRFQDLMRRVGLPQ